MTVNLTSVDPEKFQQPNPGNLKHFMESNQFTGFTSDKKVLFLELFRKSPNMSGCAVELGVDRSTIWYALERDEEFRKAFEQVKQGLCDQLESRVYEYGQRPQNFMDRIAYLRAYRPERWNPERQLTIQHNVELTTAIAGEARKAIDTTAQPERSAAPTEK